MGLIKRSLIWFAFISLTNSGSLYGGERLRLVSLSPSITEIVVDLGRGDWIVGVTNFDTEPLPPTVERVGGWIDPSFEKIVALKPDLVLMVNDQEQFVAQKLKELKIDYVSLPETTIGDILKSIEILGNVLSCSEKAIKLRDSLLTIIKTVPEPEVNGVFIVDHTPGTLNNIYVTGDGTYLDELMQLSGINNVFGDRSGYFPISLEELIERNPEIIIELVQSTDSIKTPWYQLNRIKAVKEGAVFRVNADLFSHPSSRFPVALKKLKEIVANVLHKD